MIVVTVRWEGSGGGRDCGRRQEGLRLTAVSGGQAGLAAQLDRLDTNEAFLHNSAEENLPNGIFVTFISRLLIFCVK